MRTRFIPVQALKQWKVLASVLATVVMLATNFYVASAHSWAGYHWNKGGSAITIQNYNTATNWQAAENARSDGWNKIGILYNYRVNYHTDVHVYDVNVANVNWAG